MPARRPLSRRDSMKKNCAFLQTVAELPIDFMKTIPGVVAAHRAQDAARKGSVLENRVEMTHDLLSGEIKRRTVDQAGPEGRRTAWARRSAQSIEIPVVDNDCLVRIAHTRREDLGEAHRLHVPLRDQVDPVRCV